MHDDAELLRRYTEENSEAAFAELVRRHLGLVYHAALRQCGGDRHRAQDVAQQVFIDLARKARILSRRPGLAGWLYTSTRYAAVQTMRSVRRREHREQEVQIMNELLSDSDPVVDWERLRPVIDDALFALNEPDREAMLLRFFEGHSFAEVGEELGVSEDAARVRVSRAVEKMQAFLSRRGVTSTSSALGLLLANNASAAAPAELSSIVAGAAIAGAAKAGMSGTAVFMGLSGARVAILAVVVGIGAIALVVPRRHEALARDVAAPAEKVAASVLPNGSDSNPPTFSPGISTAATASVRLSGPPSTANRPIPIGVASAVQGARDPDYRLSIGDKIACAVANEPDLACNQLIDPSGVVKLPELGQVKLAGLSVREAELAVGALYRERRILKRAAVTLEVTGHASREIQVFGAVKAPGPIVFPRGVVTLDLVDVISRAGGFTALAKTSAVRIRRSAPDGKHVEIKVDVGQLTARRAAAGQNPVESPVYPGDLIMVEAKTF